MSNNDSEDPPLFLSQVLEEEYEKLHERLPEEYKKMEKDENLALTQIYKRIHALPRDRARSALCLSGGGIRSATFALGIIQGMAAAGLFDKFHYLSTVSGGGYIGSWLTAWIRNYAKKNGRQPNIRDESIKKIKAKLQNKPIDQSQTIRVMEPEPEEICHLRAYSHFLNPRIGFLSADTWTLAGTYLRNLVINWTVLIPLLAAVLLIPRLFVAVAVVKLSQPVWWWLMVVLFSLGLISGVLAIFYIGVKRPSSVKAAGKQAPKEKVDGQRSFLRRCLLPLTFSGICFATFGAWIHQLPADSHTLAWLGNLPLDFAVVGALFHLLGWVGYSWSLRKWRFSEGLIVVVSGAIGGCLAWLAASKILPVPGLNAIPATEIYVCLALSTFLFAFLLAATLFVGLLGRYTSEEDREWWARAGSWMLIVIVLWSGANALVLFGPLVLLNTPWLISSAGGISGIVSTVLGWSSKTASSKEKSQIPAWQSMLVNNALSLAAFVFIMVLIAALSLGTTELIQWVAVVVGIKSLAPEDYPLCYTHHICTVHYTPWWLIVVLVVALGLLGLLMSRLMNINKFSLQAMYRNRLIRAYLGASRSRKERKPDPFTGFDPDDDIKMCELLPLENSKGAQNVIWQGHKLLHIVNATLNLARGNKLAWQQRKAESFTFSPLHCGNLYLGYRLSAQYGGDKDPVKLDSRYFRPLLQAIKLYVRNKDAIKLASSDGNSAPNTMNEDTSKNEGEHPITLGNAVTISGAAVSPNMGYHSSPVISFLLTLFNVRLGCWLGNPGKAGEKTYPFSQPRWAVLIILAEAFGLTNDASPYVYLSDGGHFENLGLYEMVLRRCRFIVVSDASCDAKYGFSDLGNAIHKIRVDLGIPIEFDDGIPIRAWNDKSQQEKRKFCAIGRIRYSCVDSEGPNTNKDLDGVLVYIKPAICGDEPADVLNYARTSKTFPHESTGDQFFSESQFESYRMLGFHMIQEICQNQTVTGFEEFEERVGEYLANSHLGWLRKKKGVLQRKLKPIFEK